VNLPTATRILVAVTVTYRPYLLAAIGLMVLLALAAFAWSRTDKGGLALERMRMRLPLVGETLTKFQFAQFCRTLSTLLAGGTPLVQAMETAGGAIRGKQQPGNDCRARMHRSHRPPRALRQTTPQRYSLGVRPAMQAGCW